MPHLTKIATCCYCGTRAALVLAGRHRHELACSGCGAPLRELKPVKSPQGAPATAAIAAPRAADRVERPKPVDNERKSKPKKPRKSKLRKRKARLADWFEEAWDVVEDIFD